MRERTGFAFVYVTEQCGDSSELIDGDQERGLSRKLLLSVFSSSITEQHCDPMDFAFDPITPPRVLMWISLAAMQTYKAQPCRGTYLCQGQ